MNLCIDRLVVPAIKTLLPEGYGNTYNNLILYLAALLTGIGKMTVNNRVIYLF